MSGDMSGGRQSAPNSAGLQLPDNVPEQEDDEFGEFEGFEGAQAEPVQAQAVPSPWATFPDLLPVQTSSTGTASEESAPNPPCRSSENRSSESWPDAVVAPVHRASEAEGAVGGVGPVFVPPTRPVNPPDVSLGACSSTANFDAPSDVGAGVGDVLPGAAAEPRMDASVAPPSASRQQQAPGENLLILQQQVAALQQENQQLQHQLVQCQAQVQALRAQLAQQQQQHQDQSAESRRSDHQFSLICQRLQELQAGMEHLRESRNVSMARGDFESTFGELRTGVERRLSEVCRQWEERNASLEASITKRFTEEMRNLHGSVENAVQHLSDRISASSSSTALPHSQSNASLPPQPLDANAADVILASVRSELRRHTQEQQSMLDRERRRQIAAVSQALKAACTSLMAGAGDENEENNTLGDLDGS